MDTIKHGRIVLFDGVCNLCNAAVRFIIKNDRRGLFRFASLQSEAAVTMMKDYGIMPAPDAIPDTFIYFEDGKPYFKSTAALKIARELRFPFNLLYLFIFIPSPLRNLVYDFISKRRYPWFGKKEECMVPDAGLEDRFIS